MNYIRIPSADKVQVELVPMTAIEDVSLTDQDRSREAAELPGGNFESTGECQAFLRTVQIGTQEGSLASDMPEPPAQAEARLEYGAHNGRGPGARRG